MATKKDNLPLTLDQDSDSTGTITYANEVIAIIAGVAANEVEGVAGMCSGGGITDVFGRNKNITRGVKVELGTEEAAVDIYLIIEYGTPIQTAASNVQENVRKAIESMTTARPSPRSRLSRKNRWSRCTWNLRANPPPRKCTPQTLSGKSRRRSNPRKNNLMAIPAFRLA